MKKEKFEYLLEGLKKHKFDRAFSVSYILGFMEEDNDSISHRQLEKCMAIAWENEKEKMLGKSL